MAGFGKRKAPGCCLCGRELGEEWVQISFGRMRRGKTGPQMCSQSEQSGVCGSWWQRLESCMDQCRADGMEY